MKNCKLNSNYIDKSKFKILVVEDSRTVNKIVTMTLSRYGYYCKNAFTLNEAKDILNKEQFDLILLDLHLPDGEGAELVENILDTSDTKIIILTSDTQTELREYFFRFGILDYFNKSEKLIQIIYEIDKVIEKTEQNKYNNILIIEDSKVISSQLDFVLSRRNYNVICAYDGTTGLEILYNEDIDLLLLDMELPDIHGTKILNKIKTQYNFVNLPILAMSGNDDPVIIREVLKGGAMDFLKKPLILEEFVLKVDIWIDYRRKDFWLACEKKILQEYKDIVDKSNIVSKTDLKGNIIYVNDKFCEVTGYSKAELIGKDHNIIRDPSVPDEVFAELWETIQNKQTWFGKLRNKTKQDTFYWADTSISPIVSANNETIEYIALTHNITELEEAKTNLEDTHKKISDSIKYASFIQKAIIPSKNILDNYFKDSFIIWKPQNIVGGDIYLINDLNEDECILMVIDCTGHGVPGAFITMMVKSIEEQIKNKLLSFKEKISTSKILSFFNKSLKELMSQKNDSDSISNVGFDGQVVYYNKKDSIIKCSSARNEIFIIQDDQLTTIKGDRHSIGYSNSDIDYIFKEHTIKIDKDTKLYISSDGFWDQLGGEHNFPFGKSKFKSMIQTHHTKPMEEQKDIFLDTLDRYKLDMENNDDITFVAIDIESKNHNIIKKDNDDILFDLKGDITQETIVNFVETVKEKLEFEQIQKKVINAILVITIEQLQNILHYSKNSNYKLKNVSSVNNIYCIIGYDNNKKKYFVKSSNQISSDNKVKIKDKIDTINKLDKIEQKKLLRNLLRSGEATHKKGAGIGLIEMAKRSKEPLIYDFIKFEDEYYLELKVYIG